jgi:hypothetical protein
MAGYIFSLDNIDSLKLYADKGVYATKLSTPDGFWRTSHEGTFADYVTMKKKDNIYFFIKRKIYGIGKLIKIGCDCKYFNYPEAGLPQSFNYEEKKELLLLDEANYSIDQRFICIFKPDPHFFIKGIDMDDVLSSKPQAFKMLRAFWKLSFIKFDNEENQAFKDVLLKYNQDALNIPRLGINIFQTNYENEHSKLLKKLKNNNYEINISSILSSCANEDYLKHEMALEVGLLYQLSNNEQATIDIFGKWDYLSHQVIASPFKPIDYMDKMDIFGYSFITGFEPTRGKYLIIELKRDNAQIQNLEQLMKYVDWIKNEYCFGDYAMIKAFLIAYNFDDNLVSEKSNIGIRKFTIGMKPAKSCEWRDITLVKYLYNNNTHKIDFSISE